MTLSHRSLACITPPPLVGGGKGGGGGQEVETYNGGAGRVELLTTAAHARASLPTPIQAMPVQPTHSPDHSACSTLPIMPVSGTVNEQARTPAAPHLRCHQHAVLQAAAAGALLEVEALEPGKIAQLEVDGEVHPGIARMLGQKPAQGASQGRGEA